MYRTRHRRSGLLPGRIDHRSHQPAADNGAFTRPNRGAARHGELSRDAENACFSCYSLRSLLLKDRSSYMRFGQYVQTTSPITERQRDLIERESENFLLHYTEYVSQTRTDKKRPRRRQSKNDTIDKVLDMLGKYLRKALHVHSSTDAMTATIDSVVSSIGNVAKSAQMKKSFKAAMGEYIQQSELSEQSQEQSSEQETEETEVAAKIEEMDEMEKLEEADVSSSEETQSDDKEEPVRVPEPKKKTIGKGDKTNQKKTMELNIENELEAICRMEGVTLEQQRFIELNIDRLNERIKERNNSRKNARNNTRINTRINRRDSAHANELHNERDNEWTNECNSANNPNTEGFVTVQDHIRRVVEAHAGLHLWSCIFITVLSFVSVLFDWYYK